MVTNNIAELDALIEGLPLCKDLDIRKVAIEGDSQIINNALRMTRPQKWKLNSRLGRALELLEYFEDILFNHIYREGNIEVNKLANLGANGIFIENIGCVD